MDKMLFCFATALGQVLRPRKKILDKGQICIVHVFGNARQQIFQMFVNLQLVVLGGFYQTVDRGTGLRSVVGINDVPVDRSITFSRILDNVVGRKNWLFGDSIKGAEACAVFYSMYAAQQSVP